MEQQPTIYISVSSYHDSVINTNEVICTTYNEQTAIARTVKYINEEYGNIISEEELRDVTTYQLFNSFIYRSKKLPRGNLCIIHKSEIS